MRYVLDASVAVKWALPEPGTRQSVKLLNEFRRGLHELIAPDIFPIEVAHALTKTERRGVIQPPLGTRRFRGILRNPPELHAHLPLLPQAFAISSRYRVAINDCLDVALANQDGCPLSTGDQRLIKALQATFPFIVDLATV